MFIQNDKYAKRNPVGFLYKIEWSPIVSILNIRMISTVCIRGTFIA